MSTTKKNSPAKTAKKAPAKKAAPAPVVPTPDNPLPSGWVRQSTVRPADDIGASRFTTQTQRRLLRAVVAGEPVNATEVPAPTARTIRRLKDIGFVQVAKNGRVTASSAGRTFVAANPAPKVRAPKKAAKGTKAAKKVASAPERKKAAKARIAKVAKKA